MIDNAHSVFRLWCFSHAKTPVVDFSQYLEWFLNMDPRFEANFQKILIVLKKYKKFDSDTQFIDKVVEETGMSRSTARGVVKQLRSYRGTRNAVIGNSRKWEYDADLEDFLKEFTEERLGGFLKECQEIDKDIESFSKDRDDSKVSAGAFTHSLRLLKMIIETLDEKHKLPSAKVESMIDKIINSCVSELDKMFGVLQRKDPNIKDDLAWNLHLTLNRGAHNGKELKKMINHIRRYEFELYKEEGAQMPDDMKD